jgi:fatty acid desaturase
MFRVGRHSGAPEQAPTAQDQTSPGRRSVLLLALGMTITLVAWGVLVSAAIEFGKEARSGEPEAWTFLVLAALGATACLFLALLLGARALAVVRGKASPPPPPRPVGGRRRKID